MSEETAKITDRRPQAATEPLRDGRDVLAAAVHEQDVDVAPGGELGAAVAPHGDQRDAAVVAVGGGLEQVAQPAVDQAGVAPAPRDPGEGGVAEELVAAGEHVGRA